MFDILKFENNKFNNSSAQEKTINLLLFLFPVFAVSVRHWASSLYALIALFSLIIYLSSAKNFKPKTKQDYIFISILFFYFLSFLLSTFVNGWDKDATYALGVEIKFVAVIPLYLLLRTYKGGLPYLMAGTIFGIISSFVVFLYELFNVGHGYSVGIYKTFTNGPYGHLFIGPITAFFLIILINWNIRQSQSIKIKIISAIAVVLGLFPVINSYARSAYLACFVSFLIMSYLSLKGIYRYLFLISIVFGGFIIYTSIPKVEHRVDSAIKEVKNYFSYPNPALNPRGNESLHTRFEMWRSAKYFFRDHPFFGVGRFHFQRDIKKYIDEKLIHPAAGTGSQPHNIFVEALIEEGLIGLITLLALICWPIYRMLKYRKNPYSSTGILVIVTIVILGLTESAPIVKDNFSAVFMIFMVTTFAAFNNYQDKKVK